MVNGPVLQADQEGHPFVRGLKRLDIHRIPGSVLQAHFLPWSQEYGSAQKVLRHLPCPDIVGQHIGHIPAAFLQIKYGTGKMVSMAVAGKHKQRLLPVCFRNVSFKIVKQKYGMVKLRHKTAVMDIRYLHIGHLPSVLICLIVT